MTYIPLIVALIALLGVATTQLYLSARAERQRRRDLYARALAAVYAYHEMPFEIRRRRHEDNVRSEERVRLSERFSDVQKELATCQTLIRADGNDEVADLYDALVTSTRQIAGGQARKAWNIAPITRDTEMNLPDVREALAPIKDKKDVFATAIATVGPRLWLPTRRLPESQRALPPADQSGSGGGSSV